MCICQQCCQLWLPGTTGLGHVSAACLFMVVSQTLLARVLLLMPSWQSITGVAAAVVVSLVFVGVARLYKPVCLCPSCSPAEARVVSRVWNVGLLMPGHGAQPVVDAVVWVALSWST